MKGRFVYVLYVVLALAVLAWGYRLLDNEERRLLKRLDELAELLAKEGAESDLVAANKGRLVGNFFSRDFEVHLIPFGQRLADRARLGQVVMGYRREAKTVRVTFSDSQVEISGETAEMQVRAAVSGDVDGQSRRETYRFYFRWLQEDGVWRIEQADLLEVVEGLEGLL